MLETLPADGMDNLTTPHALDTDSYLASTPLPSDKNRLTKEGASQRSDRQSFLWGQVSTRRPSTCPFLFFSLAVAFCQMHVQKNNEIDTVERRDPVPSCAKETCLTMNGHVSKIMPIKLTNLYALPATKHCQALLLQKHN